MSIKIKGVLNTLLSRRDWVYTLSLLVPFIICNLALKVSSIVLPSRGGAINVTELGLAPALHLILYLMRSEIAFSLGYALLWIGLFVLVKKGTLRGAVVFLFHTTTILAAIVTICAYQYLQQTGTTLDYNMIALWLPQLEEIKPMVAHSGSLSLWILLAAAVFYAIFGPWLIVRFVGSWQRWLAGATEGRLASSFVCPVVLCLLSLGFGSFSLLPANSVLADVAQPEGAWKFGESRLRNPFIHVAMTAAKQEGEEFLHVANDSATENSAPATLLPTGSERRNVVLIFLESTRAQSVTPYNKDLETTPFLDELAKSSLFAEQAYAVVPWSSKANVASNCGIFPHLGEQSYGSIAEAKPGGIPTQCIAELLGGQGYSTVFFQSSTQNFENWPNLINNLGYEEYYPLESMNTEDFEEVQYPGHNTAYEDNIMLKPSEDWLKEHTNEPLLATYWTSAPHHAYTVPERYGEKEFTQDEELNRYLNTIRYQDFFLKNLFDQYKKLGLYEDTVFVVLGDHGEAFGEHDLYMHGLGAYEEALRIPLIIHDPQGFKSGEHVEEPVSQLDILPTVTDLLGFEIEGGTYWGSSLLKPVPSDRPLMFGCLLEKCLASRNGSEKYIYHYGDRPDEVFDLSEDPLERTNLASERGVETVEQRNTLLAWRLRVDAMYRGPARAE